MNKQILNVILAGSLISASAVAGAKESAHWSYSGHQGPAHWGELAPEFATCAGGKNQSPVDISHTIKGELESLTVAYKPAGEAVVNNGHTIQVNYAAGSTLGLDGHEFELKQFHFHSPSENTVKGQSYPLEAHFVHADKQGNLAVVALMFEQGEANQELSKVWAKMPKNLGEQAELSQVVSALALWPSQQDYYRFNGSLTTPPCSEGVSWIVLKSPVSASAQQIDDFTALMQHPNNRPLQAINARTILE
ncbi:carbonic anhydrase [Agarivorans sp. Toyoura001]|uniref:carbonic anhydrase n=1 Tax=Agarivorans sp. Toyoura001 TaxID=2283141 RepID=UPI0010EFC1E7|nr:carbonic anhydrase [Agarivorans sp. Toyoura001]GDY24936.1 carbonic anhydrase [Agarivorans sp. Toyoura001]